MSRLADLLTGEDALSSLERIELRELLQRLENSAYSADDFLSRPQTSFDKRVRFQRELDIGGRWIFQQSTTIDQLNFKNIGSGNTLMSFHNLADRISMRYLGFTVPAAITISGGVISVTHTYSKVRNEGAAATDDLDTINDAAGATITGRLLILAAFDDAQTVVVKDGTGNLRLAGDMSLDTDQDRIVLLGDTNVWYELCRSNNA